MAGLQTSHAYIMEFKVTGKADSKVEASIGMEITGLVTWTKQGAGPLRARARDLLRVLLLAVQLLLLLLLLPGRQPDRGDEPRRHPCHRKLRRKEVTVEKWRHPVWPRTITAAERDSFMLRASPPADGEEAGL